MAWPVLGVLLTAYLWSEVVIVRDGTVYRRDLRWREPLLLDHLRSITLGDGGVPQAIQGGVQLTDRYGSQWTFAPRIYDWSEPLTHYLLDLVEEDRTIVVEEKAVARLLRFIA